MISTAEDIVGSIGEGGFVMLNAQALPFVKTLCDPPAVCTVTSKDQRDLLFNSFSRLLGSLTGVLSWHLYFDSFKPYFVRCDYLKSLC